MDKWNEIKFSDLFSYIPNNTFSRADLNYELGEYKNVHYGDVLIRFGPILDAGSEALPYITGYDNCKKESLLMDGDVIIADTAEDETVGKATEIINIGYQKIVSGLHTIACRPVIKMAPTYLGFYINTENYHKQLFALMQGVKVLSISKSNIEGTTIRYPNLCEQTKICSLLTLLESRLGKQRELIEHLKKYKRGFISHIFSSNSSWTEHTISEIGIVVTGNTPPTNNAENYIGDKLFCAPGDLGQCKYISKTEKQISEAALNKSRKIPKGSVLVTCIGSTIGKLGIANEEMLTNQQINSIIVHGTYCNEFVYYALEYNFPRFLSHVGKQAVPILSKGQFEELSLLLPSIEEQRKFAAMASLLDARIEQSVAFLNCLSNYKRGILQQLLI